MDYDNYAELPGNVLCDSTITHSIIVYVTCDDLEHLIKGTKRYMRWLRPTETLPIDLRVQ